MSEQVKEPVINKFSDFAKEHKLEGVKVSIDNVCKKDIVVLNYSIITTKYSKECAQIQFRVFNHTKLYVTFTSSKVIIRQLTQYADKLPFRTVIKKIVTKNNNHYFTFS